MEGKRDRVRRVRRIRRTRRTRHTFRVIRARRARRAARAFVERCRKSSRRFFRALGPGFDMKDDGETVWSVSTNLQEIRGNYVFISICIQEETRNWHNVWRGIVKFNKTKLSYKDTLLREKYGDGDVHLSALLEDSGFYPQFKKEI